MYLQETQLLFLYCAVLKSSFKDGSISEGILTSVLLPTKCSKSHPWAEKMFTEKGGKFKFSAQGKELAPFVGHMTKSQNTLRDKSTFKSSLLAGSHHQFRKLLVRFSTKECFTNKFIDQFDGIFQTCHLIWIQGHLVRWYIFLN